MYIETLKRKSFSSDKHLCYGTYMYKFRFSKLIYFFDQFARGWERVVFGVCVR